MLHLTLLLNSSSGLTIPSPVTSAAHCEGQACTLCSQSELYILDMHKTPLYHLGSLLSESP